MNEPSSARPVRSFVRRSGRLTRAQARALEDLWPRWGIDAGSSPLDLDRVFGRSAPRVLEVGFGTGQALLDWALQHPEQDVLGIEVHTPGIGHCLLGIERLGVGNVRLLDQDAQDVLSQRLPDGCLHGLQLFFPDPWPKKRHHKRRIVQPAFVAEVARVLSPGGFFHVATDWPPYAEHIREVLAMEPGFRESADTGSSRPVTRFAARGARLGHPIWDGHWRRVTAG
ncbi:MAG: tRNA (guanosine(46)-N7)-methyltransferase TrmB [Chromatiales bacterium]|nr:tRNA (guanosine(46)-N7)-methyltransferase TrmB [Chromatiales bacterium]